MPNIQARVERFLRREMADFNSEAALLAYALPHLHLYDQDTWLTPYVVLGSLSPARNGGLWLNVSATVSITNAGESPAGEFLSLEFFAEGVGPFPSHVPPTLGRLPLYVETLAKLLLDADSAYQQVRSAYPQGVVIPLPAVKSLA